MSLLDKNRSNAQPDDHGEPGSDEDMVFHCATGPGALVDCGRMRRNLYAEGLDCGHYASDDDAWRRFIGRVA